MVRTSEGGCKRKLNRGYKEEWMKAPITFPLISYDEASDEPLIIEVEVEGYLVNWIFMDERAASDVRTLFLELSTYHSIPAECNTTQSGGVRQRGIKARKSSSNRRGASQSGVSESISNDWEIVLKKVSRIID
ncbi:hypothetical protein Tco_0671986 [Tanacetum coccineum]